MDEKKKNLERATELTNQIETVLGNQEVKSPLLLSYKIKILLSYQKEIKNLMGYSYINSDELGKYFELALFAIKVNFFYDIPLLLEYCNKALDKVETRSDLLQHIEFIDNCVDYFDKNFDSISSKFGINETTNYFTNLQDVQRRAIYKNIWFK